MLYKDTTATQKIFQLNKRIRAVAGGTSASKTISILVWCIDYAQSVQGELVSVVSESYPHLKKGAMLDFENIMKGNGYWEESRWHKTEHTYTFNTGTKIEFFSVDTYGKAHGPRRDVLFINEANNLDYNIADQLITRTRKIVWLDWNPTFEFWFYLDMQPNRDDIDFITLTYKDNEALDPITIMEIESHRHNKNWWAVYGEGRLGEVEGRIYTGWAIIDEVPHEARLVRRGLDFGYSNDPAAVVDIYWHNGGLVLDESLYQKGMLNKELADFIKNSEQPEVLVKADSAEPKSIDELRLYGVNILPVTKGKDSVNHGIQRVQSFRVSVTKRSVNLIKEYRSYMFETNKEGELLTVPMQGRDHLMDAIRYGIEGYQEEQKREITYEKIDTPEDMGMIPRYRKRAGSKTGDIFKELLNRT